MPRRSVHALAVTLAAAALVGSACAGITAGGSNDTLAPLVPDFTGVPVTQAGAIGPDGNTVLNTQGSTTTLPRDELPQAVETDDSDPLSVAARFLAAASSGDEATGAALELPGRQPTTFDWARAAFAQYTDIAGAQAWGNPSCAEPAGDMVACSWLQTDTPPTLILVREGDAWKISNPMFNVAGEPQAAGTGCIAGSSSVNFRGGPGTNWPRFTQLQPGSCGIAVFDAFQTDPSNGDRWRLIEADGRRGWIIERVLNLQ